MKGQSALDSLGSASTSHFWLHSEITCKVAESCQCLGRTPNMGGFFFFLKRFLEDSDIRICSQDGEPLIGDDEKSDFLLNILNELFFPSLF